jgi:hypothetical protein
LRRSVALVLLTLAACSSGAWVWRRSDGSGDPQRLREDIDACEEFARTLEDDDPVSWHENARPWGGWGSFPFEVCMHERKWVLNYVSSEPQVGTK